jgi:hypothetical protein
MTELATRLIFNRPSSVSAIFKQLQKPSCRKKIDYLLLLETEVTSMSSSIPGDEFAKGCLGAFTRFTDLAPSYLVYSLHLPAARRVHRF